MKGLLELSEEKFKENVIIKFDSINEGFNNYNNALLSPKENKDLALIEEDLINFIKSLYKLNRHIQDGDLIIDFYISRLSSLEFENLYNSLSDDDKDILIGIKNKDFKSNYFIVTDEKILEFLVRLCTREMFFVTFYFTGTPLTIWGNYNLKFPVFYELLEDIDKYKDLLDQYSIKLN